MGHVNVIFEINQRWYSYIIVEIYERFSKQM